MTHPRAVTRPKRPHLPFPTLLSHSFRVADQGLAATDAHGYAQLLAANDGASWIAPLSGNGLLDCALHTRVDASDASAIFAKMAAIVAAVEPKALAVARCGSEADFSAAIRGNG